jgi:hypothetical protein
VARVKVAIVAAVKATGVAVAVAPAAMSRHPRPRRSAKASDERPVPQHRRR